MRSTQLLRRTTQALSNEEASRLVTAAAQRASARQRKRPTWLRRNMDLITIGAACLVAGTALKNRREHEERVGLLEAELKRIEKERDEAVQVVDRIRTSLTDDVAEGVKVLNAASGRSERANREREEGLRKWVLEGVDRVVGGGKGDEVEKPKLI